MLEAWGDEWSTERWVHLVATVPTNLSFFPCIWMAWRIGNVFAAVIGMFTMISSAMYHLCDTLEYSVLLSEGQWHRLDNVFSVIAVSSMFLGYAGHTPTQDSYANMFFFCIACYAQEKDPWNENYTIGPIVVALLYTIGRRVVTGTAPMLTRRTEFGCGIIGLGFALTFFYRGLDESNDWGRVNHGMWHFCMGFAAYLMGVGMVGDFKSRFWVKKSIQHSV